LRKDSSDNTGFVLDLFDGILGREPEDSELNNKIAALVEGNDRSMMVWGYDRQLRILETVINDVIPLIRVIWIASSLRSWGQRILG